MLIEPVSAEVLKSMMPKPKVSIDYSQIKEALETFPAVLIRDLDGRNPKAVSKSIHQQLGRGAVGCYIQENGQLLVVKKEKKEKKEDG